MHLYKENPLLQGVDDNMNLIELRSNSVLIVVPLVFIPDNVDVIIPDKLLLVNLLLVTLCFHHCHHVENRFQIMVFVVNCVVELLFPEVFETSVVPEMVFEVNGFTKRLKKFLIIGRASCVGKNFILSVLSFGNIDNSNLNALPSPLLIKNLNKIQKIFIL